MGGRGKRRDDVVYAAVLLALWIGLRVVGWLVVPALGARPMGSSWDGLGLLASWVF